MSPPMNSPTRVTHPRFENRQMMMKMPFRVSNTRVKQDPQQLQTKILMLAEIFVHVLFCPTDLPSSSSNGFLNAVLMALSHSTLLTLSLQRLKTDSALTQKQQSSTTMATNLAIGTKILCISILRKRSCKANGTTSFSTFEIVNRTMMANGNCINDYGKLRTQCFLLREIGRQQQAKMPDRLAVYSIPVPDYDIAEILLSDGAGKQLIFQNSSCYMKVKGKPNLSFISNQQLIENLRNKSSKNLSRNRSVDTSISLIERKSYDAGPSTANTNVHNQNVNPNISVVSNSGKEQSNGNLMRFLKENISNKKLLTQVEGLINQMPRQEKAGISKGEAALMAKIEELYLDKSKLKKEKKALENKLQEQAKQSEHREQELRRQNERLHKLVMKQSEMITNQGLSEFSGAQDLRRILVAQAKSIEALKNNKGGKILGHR